MLAAIAAAIVLRFFQLGNQSLWVDEIFTWHNAAIGGSLSLKEIFQNDHGPLLQVILHQLGNVFGDSEFVLRVPAVIASLALVPVMAALAHRLIGVKTAAPAAWIAALSPYLIWYGQEARNYSFAILFASVAIYAAVRWREDGGRMWPVLFVVACWLGLLSNLSVALVLPVLFLYVALPHGGTRGKPMGALVAAAALVALESPWLFEYTQRLAWGRLVPARDALPGETPLRGGTTFSLGGYPFTFSSFSVGYTLGPSMRELHQGSPWQVALAYWPLLFPAAVVFGFLGFRGIFALANKPRHLILILGILLVPILLLTYAALQNFKVFNPRYVSPAIAGYYLLLAAGWAALRPNLRLWSGVLVLALWLLSLGNYYFDPQHRKEDFRAAVNWLTFNLAANDQLIATANYAPLEYYWRGHKPDYELYWLGYAQQEQGTMEEKFEALEDGTRMTFVVVSRPFLDDPEGRFERYLREERGSEPIEFAGVRIYRLKPSQRHGHRQEAPDIETSNASRPTPVWDGESGKVSLMQGRKYRG